MTDQSKPTALLPERVWVRKSPVRGLLLCSPRWNDAVEYIPRAQSPAPSQQVAAIKESVDTEYGDLVGYRAKFGAALMDLGLLLHAQSPAQAEWLTVESALKELREVCPDSAVSVQFATDGRNHWVYLRRKNKIIANGPTLNEAMAHLQPPKEQ